MSDNRQWSRTHTKLSKVNSTKMHNLIRKQVDVKRCSTEEDVQMAEKHWKDGNVFSHQADANEDCDELFSCLVQSLSRVWLFTTSMDCSMPDFPVHHQLPKHVQSHVHRVGDAIQPSHPRSSPSPPAFSLSQHQGLFQRVSFSHQLAKVLELLVYSNQKV